MSCPIALEIQYPHEPTDATLKEPGNKAWRTYLPNCPHYHHITMPYSTSHHFPKCLLRYGKKVHFIVFVAVPSVTITDEQRGLAPEAPQNYEHPPEPWSCLPA